MPQVTPVPSCLADSLEANFPALEKAAPGPQAGNEGFRRVRLSAATIGLAISMSAAGLGLATQSEVVLAASTVAPEAKPIGLPPLGTGSSHAFQPSTPANEKPAPPAIKHEVKAGESIWQLSQEYQVKPEAIAASNQLDVQADLEVGQKLKIPSLDEARGKPVAGGRQAESLSPALENLRETRKRLQESLAALKTEEPQTSSLGKASVIEVSDVSQPAQPPVSPQVTALSPNAQESQGIEIPVQGPETDTLAVPDRQETAHLDAIPIPVPTPETEARKPGRNEEEKAEITTLPAPLSSAKTLPPPQLPPASASESPQTTAKAQPHEVPALPTASTANFKRPIPIPVPTPQTASVAPVRQPDWGTAVPVPSPLNLPQPGAAPAESRQVYQVRPGDTLNSIARRYGLSAAELMQANNLRNPNLIKIDQRLIVPMTTAAQPVRQAPTTITGLPLAASPLTTAQSGLPNLPLPKAAAWPDSAQTAPGAETGETAVETAMASYREKLKADVQELQQQAQNPPEAIDLTVQSVPSNARPATPDSINAEWTSTRQAGKGQVAQQPASAQEELAQADAQSQVVASAPSNVQEYNDSLQLPIGATVAPELPPLSSPDKYLPDTPLKFNGYIWPAKGVLTSGYGWRWGRMHKGIDIAAPIGTPIFAAAPGEVISAGWNSGGYGNLVKVKHPDGSVTLYAHNSRILVRRGEKVEQGQLISQMGSTGYSTGPHLHFEIHPGGKGATNPIALLPRR